MKAKTYDSKCHDLAVHFMTDQPPTAMTLGQEQMHLEELAIHIQEAVEAWFEYRAGDFDTRK